MASETPGIAQMIVQYNWILEDVDGEPQTFTSKMILIRGEKVFRVGLKNHVTSPVLFFMAIDVKKIGMRVKDVTYGIQDSGISPATMSEMAKEDTRDEAEDERRRCWEDPEDGSVQLFTVNLDKQINGNCTFVFRICLEGTAYGYSYQLSDRLVKDQLWDAASKNKNGTDVEFVVKGKTFSAHKAILAARSKVFEAEFRKEQPVEEVPSHSTAEPSSKKRKINSDHHQIHIDDVDPSTVENFLYFIYSGEPMGLLANQELLVLADRYQLTTLSRLCRTALQKIMPMQMMKLATNLNKGTKIPSTKIRPEKETEIFFDRTTPTFRCAWTFGHRELEKCISVMKYQNEDIFIADFTGRIGWDIPRNAFTVMHIEQPVIHCSCVKHPSFGFKIEDIYFSDKSNWFKMESRNLQKNAELLRFTTQPKGSKYFSESEFYFDIKMVSTIGNYYYEMMDNFWMTDFWTAATEQKFTDVEIFVGPVKVMEAHRVILSARSPVMNEALNKAKNTGKSTFTFGAEFDADTVKHFLNFLYTGSLETFASKSINYKQLFKLATICEVETLKKICQLADRVPNVEELTNSLLGL